MVKIPFQISYVICEYLLVLDCIGAEIAKKRPKKCSKKPMLFKKHTMVGSPILQNNSNRQ